MHADFSAAAKSAQAQILVPAVDMAAIRNRSRRAGVGARLRALAVSCAVALGVLGTAAAFAANTGGVRLWLFGDKAVLEIKSFAMTREPTPAELRRIAASATFPVIWPVGLPAKSRILRVIYTPADHPNFLTVGYGDRSGQQLAGVSIVDSRSVQSNRALIPKDATDMVTGHSPYVWRAGQETVFVAKEHNSPSIVSAIRGAMSGTSADASLTANQSMGTSIIVAPDAYGFVDAAQRLAPNDSVLLGAPQIRQLETLSAQNKPLIDGRTVVLTHIPFAHGQPDYTHATLQWRRSIALASGGVRTAASALRRANIDRKCDCAILVHRSGGTYSVWKIDAKTGKVTSLHP